MSETVYHVRGIPANMVDRFWALAEPYVKRALDHTIGEFTPADIKRYCKDKVMQLWLVSADERIVGAVTTELVVYPSRKHLLVATLGGSKSPEWIQLVIDTLSDWAKTQGCSALEARTRKGFVPVLINNYSFKHKSSIVYKEII